MPQPLMESQSAFSTTRNVGDESAMLARGAAGFLRSKKVWHAKGIVEVFMLSARRHRVVGKNDRGHDLDRGKSWSGT